jgi:hypothetical protein
MRDRRKSFWLLFSAGRCGTGRKNRETAQESRWQTGCAILIKRGLNMQKTTGIDLINLLVKIFGEQWKDKYCLDHNNLGYTLFKNGSQPGTRSSLPFDSGRYSEKEMYAFLVGMLNYKEIEKEIS